MKASVLKVLASLLAVAWVSMGCAIFQPTPPAATQPTASALAPAQPPSASSGGANLAVVEAAADPEASEPPAAAEEPSRLRAVVDRIVAAVRGEPPADTGNTGASQRDASVSVGEVVEAEADSDEAALVSESVDDALPGVGASSVQSELVEETPGDWVVRYGLPILAGLLVLHFVTRLTGSQDAA